MTERGPIWQTHVSPNEFSEGRALVSGRASYVFDEAGHKYINGFAGLSLALGLGVMPLTTAIATQVAELAYAPLFRGGHVPAYQLARRLLSLCGNGLTKVVYSVSGAEAVEAAVKIAISYQALKGLARRKKVVVLKESYHGCTLGTLPFSGIYDAAVVKRAYGVSNLDVLQINGPYCYRCPLGLEPNSCLLACVDALTRLIEEARPHEVAAVLIEPIPAAGGVLIPPPTYLRKIEEICRAHDILFIVDESACGFGRTGEMFGFQRFNASPDILILGKAVNGGYLPLGVTLVRNEIYALFEESDESLLHGGSQAGNPCATAAALACIDIYTKSDVLERSRVVASHIAERLEELRASPLVGDVRGIGMMFALEMVEDKSTKKPLSDENTRTIFGDIMRCGVILHSKKNRLLFFPPLNITLEVAAEAVAAIQRGIAQYQRRARRDN